MSTPSVVAVASTPAKENSALLFSRLIPKNWYHPKLKVAVPMGRFSTLSDSVRPGARPIWSQCAGATVRHSNPTKEARDSNR